MKLDVLVFGAHPDDAELGAGATIALEISRGKKVGVIDLTRGELGTRGTAETRDAEAAEAAKILGLSVRLNMEFEDGFFVHNRENLMALIKQIRRFRPEIVLCNAIDDRHIDHPKGSKLVSDACFLSGLLKIDTQLEGSDHWQGPWRPKKVYHYMQWKNLTPDFLVDISEFIDVKMEAIKAYRTQFHDPNSKEPETPISSKNFLDSVLYRARDMGRLIGVEYAEGFTVERPVAVASLDDLI
ncbi:MAG: hypothetical protein RLZZ241_1819 [Bacteroidota bacterium]|jgi:bacillithiol biosynthesis deacetylase BshB1